MKPVQGKSE